MTLYSPTIALSRLVVAKGSAHVFDGKFHPGLNVIRGENGSGKTTIADFIFFALGGETPQWRAEAALCDYVYAELSVNGSAVTFRRQVEQEARRPMSIFWGTFEEAQSSGSGWQVYPYAATAGKESFSQVIFRAAGIPEVKSSLTSKITLHQVMRLVYVDQKTDYEQLFRIDPFDSSMTREAVGDLLCGVYDDRLYEAELQLAGKDAEKAKLQGELKALFTILGSQGIPDLAKIGDQIGECERERATLYERLKALQTRLPAAPGDALAEHRARLTADLAKQNETVGRVQAQISQARVEMADRDLFMSALRMRLLALGESEAVHSNLGSFSFDFCPACYAPLSSQQDGACQICKSPKESRPGQNLLRLRNELEQQIRESETLQQELKQNLGRLSQELQPAIQRQSSLQLQYDEIATAAYPSSALAIADLHRRIGYLDRAIEDLSQKSKLSARVAAISEQQAALAAEMSKLSDEIAARKAAQEEIKTDISKLVATLTLDLLKRDLPREAAFQQAIQVNFNFGANQLSVDGRRTFAASSNVLLKNVFHFALLQASTQREYMRYPRLAIFDNVEDKGMEPARSHNFQNIIRQASEDIDTDHQVILFTSMIAPELENDPTLLVGPSYTHESKTLQMAAVAATQASLSEA